MPDPIVIIGAGPAGLATAIHLARLGREAIVVDAARPPIDKACGEGLMPGAVASLERMGVTIAPDGCAPFEGIRFVDEATGVSAVGRFPHGPGLGVRRLWLHDALLRRATELGVDLRFETTVSDVRGDRVVTNQGEIAADVIVAADGLHSPTRKFAGFAASHARRQRFGLRRHYTVTPWSSLVEVYWGDGVEAYVTPAGPNRVGVAFLWSGRKARFDQLLDEFPRLRARLADAPVESRDRGAGPLAWDVPEVVRGRVALVGDASGYLDAITGEGISLALHQAEALAAAIVQEDLSSYGPLHRRLVRLPFAMIHLMLWLERHPWIRRRVFQGLAGDEALFGRILQVNDGGSPFAVGLVGLLRAVGRAVVAR